MKGVAIVFILIIAIMFVACGSKKDGSAETGTNAKVESTVIDPGTISEDNAEKMADDILKDVEAL